MAVTRIRAFAWDYLVIWGYLAGVTAIGLLLTLGPVDGLWSEFMAEPKRADLVIFLFVVLPVVLWFALSESSGAGATWGKRRVGLVVVTARGGEPLSRGRALARNGLKFLPWQMAHTANFHLAGASAVSGEPPTWPIAVLAATWFLVILYLFGLTRFGGHRPPYDRLAGTVVVCGGS